ncbi:ATP-binding protein, partial [Mycobacterium kansasii]
ARKEGWQKFVNTPARVPPEALNRDELDRLTDKERTDYDRERREWHANLGPLKTRQLVEVHENLWDVIDSNAQDGDKP